MEEEWEISLGSSPFTLRVWKKKTKVSGLCSLPDAVACNVLAQLSRIDLAALAIASKSHRSLVVSAELSEARWQMRCSERYLYVLLHISPEPNPRWFILHPLQHRLKPIHSILNSAPKEGSSFVFIDWGIFVIGGSKKGKPTSNVSFFDCFKHLWFRISSMNIARCGASASLVDDKIYVFGGCSEDTDSSNWAEVFDLLTGTWDFLFVSTPKKIPFNFRRSVVIDNKEVYAVDEDGHNLSFSPSNSLLVEHGKTDSKEGGYITDWCLFGTVLICGSKGRKILWCLPYELVWKEVKGLEELQSLCGDNEICNLCIISTKRIAIFWIARPHDHPDILELWSAEISLRTSKKSRSVIRGKIEWSGAVLSDSYSSVNVLYAASVLF